MHSICGIQIFDNNKATLKETSKFYHDGSEMFMTDSMLMVINFDSVKYEYIKYLGLSEPPKSNDALFLDESGNYYFIEFKNGFIGEAKVFEINRKILDSLLIFTDIIGKGISFTRESMNYILVYNKDKNQDAPLNIDFKTHQIEKNAKRKLIRFGLGRFEKLFFKEVFTLSKEAFETEFVSKFI